MFSLVNWMKIILCLHSLAKKNTLIISCRVFGIWRTSMTSVYGCLSRTVPHTLVSVRLERNPFTVDIQRQQCWSARNRQVVLYWVLGVREREGISRASFTAVNSFLKCDNFCVYFQHGKHVRQSEQILWRDTWRHISIVLPFSFAYRHLPQLLQCLVVFICSSGKSQVAEIRFFRALLYNMNFIIRPAMKRTHKIDLKFAINYRI